MRTSILTKSKYWSGRDLKGQPAVILTIADVSEEIMTREGRADTKYFLWFMDHEKGLQLNKTRVAILEHAYGEETDYWSGKKVRLSYDPSVMMAGQAVGGVKVTTPAGVVYSQQQHQHAAAWGDAPQQQAGAPICASGKAAVNVAGKWLDPDTGQPVSPAKKKAVLVAGQWLDPDTGQPTSPPQGQGPPKTIGQRIAEGHPPAAASDGWDEASPGVVDASTGEVLTPEFDDDIPFN